MGALDLLARAEAIPALGPCRALWEDRARYREQCGDKEEAEAARARAAEIRLATAQEHYLLAQSYSRARRYGEAISELDEALRLNPRHYWCLGQRGLCHLERGDADLALADLGTCVGLRPEFAWGYYNRADVLAKCGKRKAAIADYTSVLTYSSDMVSASLNRGLLYHELRQDAQALADFEEAARHGRDDAFLHSSRGVSLESLGRHGEADDAFAAAESRASALPPEVRARLRWNYGFAVSSRMPEKAREAFEAVLQENPDHPQALYGCGMLLERRDRQDEALILYTRALDVAPAFVEARRSRAVVQARRGNLVAAQRDINESLERDHHSGTTLYTAACVAALIAHQKKGSEARQAATQAIQLLGQAFEQGYGADRAAEDPDLEGIRDNPRFRRLLHKARGSPPR
jgi:tetratricopeptide (TPR) repeat protein